MTIKKNILWRGIYVCLESEKTFIGGIVQNIQLTLNLIIDWSIRMEYRKSTSKLFESQNSIVFCVKQIKHLCKISTKCCIALVSVTCLAISAFTKKKIALKILYVLENGNPKEPTSYYNLQLILNHDQWFLFFKCSKILKDEFLWERWKEIR